MARSRTILGVPERRPLCKEKKAASSSTATTTTTTVGHRDVGVALAARVL